MSDLSTTCLQTHWARLTRETSLAVLRSKYGRLELEEVRCEECQATASTRELWMCLHCAEPLARCGRTLRAHAREHSVATSKQHSLALNLGTSQIWCYECDAEVRDMKKKKKKTEGTGDDDDDGDGGSSFAPQDVRTILFPPDEDAVEVGDSKVSEEEEEEKAKDDDHRHPKQQAALARRASYRTLYNNARGGQSGLANLGNTCFLNAGLQCLCHCPPFVGFFADLETLHEFCEAERKYKSLGRQRQMQVDLVAHMEELVRHMWRTDPPRVLAPRAILRDVVLLNPFFDGYGQHDGHEAVRCVLDNLDEGLRLSSDKSLRRSFLEESVVADIFAGRMLNKVRCLTCSNVSLKEEPFFDVSLEIPHAEQLKRVGSERGEDALTEQPSLGVMGRFAVWAGFMDKDLSLETCLHSFCTSETLMDKERYQCDKCKTKVDAKKSICFSRLPEVLTINVKRFSHNSYFSNKVSRHVSFPLRDLDMRPFLKDSLSQYHDDVLAEVKEEAAPFVAPPLAERSAPNDEHRYDLFGVVRHIGSAGGGHYIAYAKSHTAQQWLKFDDRIVTEVDEEEVEATQAYVLFYRRCAGSDRHQRLTQLVRRALSAAPPSPDEKRFISRRWLHKLEMMVVPGPIDNRDLCCAHGVPYPQLQPSVERQPRGIIGEDMGKRAVAVAPAAWDALVAELGGGPTVTGVASECEACVASIVGRQEKRRIHALNDSARKDHGIRPAEGWFMIDAGWLAKWRDYGNGKGPRPGPITNEVLFEDDECTTLKSELRAAHHYRGLYKTVWDTLVDLYGGGPHVHRPTLDIYKLVLENDDEDDGDGGSDDEEDDGDGDDDDK